MSRALALIAAFFMATGVLLASYMLGECSEIGDGFNGESFKPVLEYNTRSTEFTTWNKFWFSSAIIGQVGDVASTIDADNRGCVEANPMFGEDPNIPVIALTKVALLGTAWYLIEYVIPPHERVDARNYIYGPLAVLGVGVTAWNYNVKCM